MNLDGLRASLADRYRIERELGQGGMATVFLAQDLKHARAVAIKVLRPELAAVLGAERFLQEIRTTAQLQHPHILPLFDSGAVQPAHSGPPDLLYYVMPYIEGETLRDKLQRETQLGLDEVVRIGGDVADALDYAHRHGVIHRDIKPENILLHDGRPLVADFGIALAVTKAAGERMTETGLTLGTPLYMSPEQAAADRAIDGRTDIYALGAVTYEMLTGEPPFQGPTAQAIMAKAVKERPTRPSVVRDTVPPALDGAVLRALARLPADRFPTAAAFGAALHAADQAATVQLAAPGRQDRRRAALVLAGAAAAVVGAFLLGRTLGGSPPEGLQFGKATQVTWEPGLEISPAISPDGKTVAYAAGNGTRFRIFVRPLAGGRPVPLTGDTGAVETLPEWSRDGSRILFLRDGQVFSAPSGGGPPRQEVPVRGIVESATWSPDMRQIAYVVADSVFIRDATGTTHLAAVSVLPGMCSWGPRNLIACSAGNGWYLRPGMAFGNGAPSWIITIEAGTGRMTAVTDSAESNVAPRWAPDGRTLYFVSNRMGLPDLYSVDLTSGGQPRGAPHRLTVGLDVNTASFSGDGTRMVYSIVRTSSNIWSEPWTDGPPPVRRTPVQVTHSDHVIEGLAVSGDGHWLFYDSDASGNQDLYRMRLPTGEPERLTSDPTAEFNPYPSPDGRSVAFQSWRSGSRGIYIMPLDGGPLVEVTPHTPEQEQYPSWSPDGTRLVFASQSQPLGLFVARRGSDGSWAIRKLVQVGHWPSWSPDGRYISFADSLLGGSGLEIIAADSGPVRAAYDFSRPGAPFAETSQWSADGRTIYFKSHDPDGEGVIWAVPSAGGVPRRVLRLGDGRLESDRYGFRIAAGRIYYTRFDRQANIWVMEVRRK